MEVRVEDYDFHGWATKNDLRCSDGRVIRKDAFKHCDGQTVPLVWNHDHTDPYRIVGNVLLKNCDEGVYGYAKFNDTDLAKTARIYVEHGDITSLSIYANQLKQQGPNVVHGFIREVSLVLAGANPGASIQAVIKHDEESEEEAVIYTGEEFVISHADGMSSPVVEDEIENETDIVNEDESRETLNDTIEDSEEKATEDEIAHADSDKKTKVEDDKDKTVAEVWNTLTEEQQVAAYYIISKLLEKESDGEEDDDKDAKETKEIAHADDEETVEELWNSLNEKQKNAAYYIIAKIMEEKNINNIEGGNADMKHNVFDREDSVVEGGVLSHADQEAILELAKDSTVGSFKKAMQIYVANNKDTLAHGIDEIDKLFPDYKDVHPGAPELIERDQKWVQTVLKKAHKSPVSRVRMRQVDARAAELRAKGYNNREEQKALSGNLKLLMRTFDPQTVFYRDELHRDDINDINDFDVVSYQKAVMKHNMEEEIALAALVGDGREDTHADKIHEEHIRSVWHDDELYTIHTDVDIEAAKAELQGSDTGVHFGENYIYAEAIITAALYSREKYKGKGQLDFYCTPHLLNVMLLARDLNGRRIYDSKEDIAKVLNVGEIYEVEQMEGLTRTTEEGDTKKLLGIFVNMANYQFGSTKGGELTSFEDFDIDFNKYKYLMETRLSGALTEIYSAIALEEPVADETGL